MKRYFLVMLLCNVSFLLAQFQYDLLSLQKGTESMSFRSGDAIVVNGTEVIYDSIDPNSKQIKTWKGDDQKIYNLNEIKKIQYKIGGSKVVSRFGKGLLYGGVGGFALGSILLPAYDADTDFVEIILSGVLISLPGALIGSFVGGSSGAMSKSLSKAMKVKSGEWEIILN